MLQDLKRKLDAMENFSVSKEIDKPKKNKSEKKESKIGPSIDNKIITGNKKPKEEMKLIKEALMKQKLDKIVSEVYVENEEINTTMSNEVVLIDNYWKTSVTMQMDPGMV
jgi:hypothetical protein